MEPMPSPVFNMELFFDTKMMYHKRPDGSISDFGFAYEDYKDMFINSLRQTLPDGGIWFKDLDCCVSSEDVAKFSLCGPWDRPDFTNNERELAWRLECLRTWFMDFKKNS